MIWPSVAPIQLYNSEYAQHYREIAYPQLFRSHCAETLEKNMCLLPEIKVVLRVYTTVYFLQKVK